MFYRFFGKKNRLAAHLIIEHYDGSNDLIVVQYINYIKYVSSITHYNMNMAV